MTESASTDQQDFYVKEEPEEIFENVSSSAHETDPVTKSSPILEPESSSCASSCESFFEEIKTPEIRAPSPVETKPNVSAPWEAVLPIFAANDHNAPIAVVKQENGFTTAVQEQSQVNGVESWHERASKPRYYRQSQWLQAQGTASISRYKLPRHSAFRTKRGGGAPVSWRIPSRGPPRLDPTKRVHPEGHWVRRSVQHGDKNNPTVVREVVWVNKDTLPPRYNLKPLLAGKPKRPTLRWHDPGVTVKRVTEPDQAKYSIEEPFSKNPHRSPKRKPTILSPKKSTPKKQDRTPSPPTMDHDYCVVPPGAAQQTQPRELETKNDEEIAARETTATATIRNVSIPELLEQYRGKPPLEGKNIFTCKICSEGFLKFVEFEQHNLSHVTSERTAVEATVKTKGKRKSSYWTCSVCREVFENTKNLKNHLAAVHKTSDFVVLRNTDSGGGKSRTLSGDAHKVTSDKPTVWGHVSSIEPDDDDIIVPRDQGESESKQRDYP